MAAEKKATVVEKEVAPAPEGAALDEVYQFTLPDGQVHAWHGTPEDLKNAHPDAVITGQLMTDELGQGSFVAYAPKPSSKKAATTEAAEPEKEEKSE